MEPEAPDRPNATEPAFRPRRDHLLAVAERLQHLGRSLEAPGLDDEFAAVERRLAEATFKLLVIGEYKRGKSTLINALLGRPLLPTGVLPLTSVVTEIAYGDALRLEVEHQSGERISAPVERLRDYVTEPGNPGNEKRVRRVVVFDAGSWLRDGVRIVDTPGIGSIHGSNTQAAYESLDEADAVVFVLAADQPIGREEHRLLEAVRPVTDRVSFVLNRVDLLAPEELDTVLGFTREQLASACGEPEAPIHPLSAREALEARARGAAAPPEFERFAAHLHHLLVDERAAILLERTRRLLLRAAELARSAAQAEQDAASLEAGELERAIARFAEGADRIRAREEEARVLLRHGAVRLTDQTLRELEDRAAIRIREAVGARVRSALDAGRGSVHAATRSLAEEVGDWVVEQARDYASESEALVTAGFAELLSAYERRVQELIGEIVALANRLIGTTASVPEATTSLSDRPRFHFRSWDSSGPVLPRSGWFLLRLPRPVALRFARRWLAEVVEKRTRQNLAGVRYDWTQRLQEAMWQLEAARRRQLEAAARIMAEALERALHRKRAGLPQRAAREEELASMLRELAEIEAQLAAGSREGST